MGTDVRFTDESPKASQYARCRPCFIVAIVGLLLAGMGILLVTSGALRAHSGDSLSAWAYVIPDIDGVMSPSEWSDAASLSFTTSDGAEGAIYVKNDVGDLYLAVRIADPTLSVGTTGTDKALIYFDNDHDGVGPGVGDDILAWDGYAGAGFRDGFSQGTYSVQNDTDYGGTSDGWGTATNDGTYNYFEFRHPVDSTDDGHDFSLSLGDTVGFGIRVVIDGYDRGWWPSSDLGNWADIIVASGDSLSAWAYVIPDIDGIMSPGEWSDAASQSFTTSDGAEGAIYVKNNVGDLYLAVRIADPTLSVGTTGTDNALIYFDNDHDGVGPGVGDDILGWDGYAAAGFRDGFSQGTYSVQNDTDYGGTSDGWGTATNDGTYNYFELEHPLHSPDHSHDFDLSFEETVGFGIRVVIDGYDRGWWPSSDLGNWADIIVASSEDWVACSSCQECNQAINSGEVRHLYLSQDVGIDASCIGIQGQGDVVFDCTHRQILGPGDRESVGIAITGSEDVTIRNCVVGLFGSGITSQDSLVQLTGNRVCDNALSDIQATNIRGGGDNNTCDKALNWDDEGTRGCTHPCSCVVPYDNKQVYTNTELCDGHYSIDDLGATGVLILKNPNITLDCNGAELVGNGSGVGINNTGYDGVEIMNCDVSAYSTGVSLESLQTNTLSHNVVTGCSTGIGLRYVDDSYLESNVTRHCTDGIELWTSDKNELYANVSCNNSEADIKVFDGVGNRGDENECDVPVGWNDDGPTPGCTYACRECDDRDGDGVCDDKDNCPDDANTDQADGDGIRQSDLVSYWEFNEGSGATAYDSVGTNDGTLINSPVWNKDNAVLGSALEFNAHNWVETPLNIDQSSGSSGVTMLMWVYPTDVSPEVPPDRHHVISSDNGGFDWSVLREGSTWYVFTGEESRSTEFSVELNKWQHIAAVFKPGEGVTFCKGGEGLLEDGCVSIPHIGYDTSDNNIAIARNPGFGETFAGIIDEVAVYDAALTGDEIVQLYQRSLAGHAYSGDGVGDACDNCKYVYNPDQEDWEDWGGDGVGNACDNCWYTVGLPDQTDTDGDCNSLKTDPGYWDGTKWLKDPGCGDCCDLCPDDPNNDADEDLICVGARFRGSKLRGDDNCPSTPNTSQTDTDSDTIGDACDNCPNIYNPFQDDTDSDDIGDACDNCPNIYNRFQDDADSDDIGDVCDLCPDDANNDADNDGICVGIGYLPPKTDDNDNCPHNANPDQDDFNNDDVGDACDCSDAFMGPNEDGADCGGICASCDQVYRLCLFPGPWGCTWELPAKCIPIIYNGDVKDRIDVVFVPDADYGGNMNTFRSDALSLIENGYFSATEIYPNRCKFNFWYYDSSGVADSADYEPVCSRFALPADLGPHCSFVDSAAIIWHPVPGQPQQRSCSTGSTFSTSPTSVHTVLHESGHNIFGLADEYGSDGGYWEQSPPWHVFHSQASCQASSTNPAGCSMPYSNFCPERLCWSSVQVCRNWATARGLNPNECVATCSECPGLACSPNWCEWRAVGNWRECCADGGDGWWKSDPDTCTMKGGTVYGPDCHPKVLNALNSLPACANPGASVSEVPVDVPFLNEDIEMTKSVILEYNISGDQLTLLGSSIVYNSAPNHFLEHGAFHVLEVSSLGEELRVAVLDDPREFRLDDPEDFEPGMMMSDDVNFTVIMPFLDLMKAIEIRDFDTGALVHSADLSAEIVDFCRSVNYQDPQCQISDLDNDGANDQRDNCPLVSNPDQTNTDVELEFGGGSVVGDSLGDACDADDDNDGFADDKEAYVGTDPLDNCAGSPPGPGGDAWPLDINVDTYVTVGGDVLPYRGRIGATGGPPADPNWMQRLDLNADNWITVGGDVLPFRGKIGAHCT